MKTECKPTQLKFEGFSDHGRRQVKVDDQAGHVSSDAGGLLLREVEKKDRILERFSKCFVDHRNEEGIEHTVLDLVAQRVYGLCLGYEDLNDHDRLRSDPLLALLVGKEDVEGKNRLRIRDKGKALASSSTLNRLELTAADANANNRYKKIVYNVNTVKTFFIDEYIRSQKKKPREIIIDVDPTDDPIHGNQEGKFYHGYYGHYCYLPLYIFIGDELVWSELRTSDGDATKGTEEALGVIISKLRESWPDLKITVRADSDFSRDSLMCMLEGLSVDYVLGLGKNARLLKKIRKAMKKARKNYYKTLAAARTFKSFGYRTLKSWSRSRRVVGKAEHLAKGENPRFVVTSLSTKKYDARTVYEKIYCARGDMENRIKEQQMGLFADRTSSQTMRANQLRLAFSSVAYVLMQRLRAKGLRGTGLERAQVWTLRETLLKVGAIVEQSIRKIWVHLSSHHPLIPLWPRVLNQLASS